MNERKKAHKHNKATNKLISYRNGQLAMIKLELRWPFPYGKILKYLNKN